MRGSDFTIIHCWQHLGDNRGDLATDAPFVGDQSSVMSFEVESMPAINANTPPLLLIEVLRNDNAMPIVKLNGSGTYSTADSQPHSAPSTWELAVYYTGGRNLDKGTNTVQILREPTSSGNFVIGKIIIFWPVENRARSSGWISVGSERWDSGWGVGGDDFTFPGDIDHMYVNGWWDVQHGYYPESEHAIISVYVDDGRGAYQVPFRRLVSGGGQTGAVEFRYVFSTDPNYAMWLTPVVALVDGGWDRDGYIKNTYLPSLKWRVASIPAL